MALLEMIQNLAIIISLAMIYRIILARMSRVTPLKQVLVGLLFGGFTLVGMNTPFTMMPGIFYDGRSIILSLAGLFCGPITTILAALIAAAYRIYLGGGGVFAGVGTIIEASAFGLAFYFLRKATKLQVNIISLFVLGLLVHIGMLLCQLSLPNDVGWRVWREIGLYVIVFFTAVTIVIGLLFLDSENQLKDRAALQNSEKTLKKAQQLARVGSWVWNAREKKLDGSDEFFNILGLDRSSFTASLAEKFFLSIHPDDRDLVDSAWEEMLAGGKPRLMEFRIIRNSGEIRSVWMETGDLINDHQGKLISASGILQDITEKQAVETELVEKESRYRNLIMSSPDAILVNHKDRIALVNNKAVQLFGARNAEELLGKRVLDLFHPDFHDMIRERVRLLRETDQPLPLMQEKIIRLDGEVVDVDVISTTFFWHGEKDIHTILRNITGQIRMEKELRESRDFLARLADQVPGAVFQLSLSPDGLITFPFISPGMTKSFGGNPQALKTDAGDVFNFVHENDRAKVVEGMTASAKTLRVYEDEFRIWMPDGSLRWYQCNAQPEKLEDGAVIWSGIISDVTDRKKNEEKIAEQLAELRRWQSVTLGRERRTLELKEEINQLLREMGRPERYLAEASRETDRPGNDLFDQPPETESGRG